MPTAKRLGWIDLLNEVSESIPIKSENISIIEGVPCTDNKITDNSVGFSITCPSNLKLYTYRDNLIVNNKREKMLYFCESQIINSNSIAYQTICPTGGIIIWANGDGWGGGCDSEFMTTTILAGKTTTYCLRPEGFGGLYAGDHIEKQGNAFLIEGSFSDTFTKEDALQMLSTFKIL